MVGRALRLRLATYPTCVQGASGIFHMCVVAQWRWQPSPVAQPLAEMATTLFHASKVSRIDESISSSLCDSAAPITWATWSSIWSSLSPMALLTTPWV